MEAEVIAGVILEPRHVSRFELRWMKRDWKQYCQAFGHLPLSRKQWKALTVEGLARFLRDHGADVERSNEGNPGMCLRLPEALQEWVADKGGAAYVRQLLEHHARAELGAAAYGWQPVEALGEFQLWKKTARCWVCLPMGVDPDGLTEGQSSEYAARAQVNAPARLVPTAPPPARSFKERFFGQRAPI